MSLWKKLFRSSDRTDVVPVKDEPSRPDEKVKRVLSTSDTLLVLNGEGELEVVYLVSTITETKEFPMLPPLSGVADIALLNRFSNSSYACLYSDGSLVSWSRTSPPTVRMQGIKEIWHTYSAVIAKSEDGHLHALGEEGEYRFDGIVNPTEVVTSSASHVLIVHLPNGSSKAFDTRFYVDADRNVVTKAAQEIRSEPVIGKAKAISGPLIVTKDGTLEKWSALPSSVNALPLVSKVEELRSLDFTSREHYYGQREYHFSKWYYHIARLSDGTVQAFGEDFISTFDAGKRKVVQIDAFGTSAIALCSDGTVITNSPFVTNPSFPAKVKKVVAAIDAYLALMDDGSVVGWPKTGKSCATIPRGLKPAVDLFGGSSVIALHADGSTTRWPKKPKELVDISLPRGSRVLRIDTSSSYSSNQWRLHGIGIEASGKAHYWGDADHSEIATLPEQALQLRDISVLGTVAAGINLNGELVIWGRDNVVQRFKRLVSPLVNKRVKSVRIDYDNILVLTESGEVLAFGTNEFGECDVPAGLRDVTSIAMGRGFCLALTADGTMYKWGCQYTPSIQGKSISVGLADAHTSRRYWSCQEDGRVLSWSGKGNCKEVDLQGSLIRQIFPAFRGILLVDENGALFLAGESNELLPVSMVTKVPESVTPSLSHANLRSAFLVSKSQGIVYVPLVHSPAQSNTITPEQPPVASKSSVETKARPMASADSADKVKKAAKRTMTPGLPLRTDEVKCPEDNEVDKQKALCLVLLTYCMNAFGQDRDEGGQHVAGLMLFIFESVYQSPSKIIADFLELETENQEVLIASFSLVDQLSDDERDRFVAAIRYLQSRSGFDPYAPAIDLLEEYELLPIADIRAIRSVPWGAAKGDADYAKQLKQAKYLEADPELPEDKSTEVSVMLSALMLLYHQRDDLFDVGSAVKRVAGYHGSIPPRIMTEVTGIVTRLSDDPAARLIQQFIEESFADSNDKGENWYAGALNQINAIGEYLRELVPKRRAAVMSMLCDAVGDRHIRELAWPLAVIMHLARAAKFSALNECPDFAHRCREEGVSEGQLRSLLSLNIDATLRAHDCRSAAVDTTSGHSRPADTASEEFGAARATPSTESNSISSRPRIADDSQGYMYDDGKFNAFQAVVLLQADVVFFVDAATSLHDSINHIAWDGSKHSITGIEANGAKMGEHPVFMSNPNYFAMGVADVMGFVETNERFHVPINNIHECLHEFILNQPLTGMTFMNLLTYQLLFISQLNDDKYIVTMDANVARGLPRAFSLAAELIRSVRSYNNIQADFSVAFVLMNNIDRFGGVSVRSPVVGAEILGQMQATSFQTSGDPTGPVRLGLEINSEKPAQVGKEPRPRRGELRRDDEEEAIGDKSQRGVTAADLWMGGGEDEESEDDEPPTLADFAEHSQDEGIEVMGTQHEGRIGRIEKLKVGDSLSLMRRPDNTHDSNAIEVRNRTGESLGWIGREFAEHLAPFLDSDPAALFDVKVKSVTPLSQRSVRSKKPLLFIEFKCKKYM